jgi:hypothetical protein
MKQQQPVKSNLHKATQITAGLILALSASSSFAADRVVKCQIDSSGSPSFKGKCLFMPEKGGSFSLQSVNRDRPIMEGLIDVNVQIIEKGVAEVRGLTTEGSNSRWGEARRSDKDKACWVGSDFRICAW